MDTKKEKKDYILEKKEEIILELEDILLKYNDFFSIDKIFISADGGKTRINRQLFNENHEYIVKKIKSCKAYLKDNIELVKVFFKKVYEKYGENNKVDTNISILDDVSFLELLQMDMDTKDLSKKEKEEFFKEIKQILALKNRVFNYFYYLDMIDTTEFNKLINNLGVEELVNSVEMFEIINCYGLQLETLNKFKEELQSFEIEETKIKNFYFLEPLFELHKKRAINFNYGGVNYKIFVEYDIDIKLKKTKKINISYLENIISNLIEQSCMDLVKQEIKKGKVQKLIEIKITKKNKRVIISIKNNGFEVKNIYNMYLSDIDNKYILDGKNLANEINIDFEINSLSNEGMEYKLFI